MILKTISRRKINKVCQIKFSWNTKFLPKFLRLPISTTINNFNFLKLKTIYFSIESHVIKTGWGCRRNTLCQQFTHVSQNSIAISPPFFFVEGRKLPAKSTMGFLNPGEQWNNFKGGPLAFLQSTKCLKILPLLNYTCSTSYLPFIIENLEDYIL